MVGSTAGEGVGTAAGVVSDAIGVSVDATDATLEATVGLARTAGLLEMKVGAGRTGAATAGSTATEGAATAGSTAAEGAGCCSGLFSSTGVFSVDSRRLSEGIARETVPFVQYSMRQTKTMASTMPTDHVTTFAILFVYQS